MWRGLLWSSACCSLLVMSGDSSGLRAGDGDNCQMSCVRCSVRGAGAQTSHVASRSQHLTSSIILYTWPFDVKTNTLGCYQRLYLGPPSLSWYDQCLCWPVDTNLSLDVTDIIWCCDQILSPALITADWSRGRVMSTLTPAPAAGDTPGHRETRDKSSHSSDKYTLN